MNPDVKTVEPLPDYKLAVRFTNDDVRQFDVAPFIDKGVFTELRDVAYFRRVRVAFGAVQWPHGQDLSADTLYVLGVPVAVSCAYAQGRA